MSESKGKNILIVFAHPEHDSLNGAILDVTRDALTSQGHTVTVSDLYQMGFNPVIGKNDIKGTLKDTTKFNWLSEITQAHFEDRVADDIRQEQMKLDAADVVIFQFPLYWLGLPAILKGWVDRVMHSGYAIMYPDNIFDNGHFKGKRALLSMTSGGGERVYSDVGMMGDINIVVWPIQNGILRYVGFDVLAPHIAFGIHSPEAAEGVFVKWRHRLLTILEEKPLFFFRLLDFDDNRGLKKEVVENVQQSIGSTTTGQHCGKALPPGGQTIAPDT